MKELKKDLFECIFDSNVDAICITTNAQYLKDGTACMGGGCARVCADRWPQTSKNLGLFLKSKNNVPYLIGSIHQDGNYTEPFVIHSGEPYFSLVKVKCYIFSFPTIDQIMDGAKLDLIEKSSREMVNIADAMDLTGILLPRPGVGVGNLPWKDVKAVIEPILDDRFTVVSFEHEEQ